MSGPESSKPDPQVRDQDFMPVSIEREGEAAIVITWSDGLIARWTVNALRKACPCATCREKKRHDTPDPDASQKPLTLPVLSAAEARPLRIEAMRPVGSYAYNIAFSDGHSSGIYPFAMLHEPPE